MDTEVTERLVAQVWQRQLMAELTTDTGERLHLLHPGRPSNLSGCDFQDSVFTIKGVKVTGNVEIHVKSSHWYSHGHHRDPQYNDIVLHVVWWHNSKYGTICQNGRAVATICLGGQNRSPERLHEYLSYSGNSSPACPEIERYQGIESLSKLLTAAGADWFASKIHLFRRALNEGDATQVLLHGIARALGYAQNVTPFEELASKLPSSLLEKIEPGADVARRALVLGTAGLLPSQRGKPIESGEPEILEVLWRRIAMPQTMDQAAWCFFRVHPHNFPTRRLIALCHLIARYRQTGLLLGILDLMARTPTKSGHRGLENGLTIFSPGYWSKHFDFGVGSKRNLALLGREKAAQIIINTILPFTCAWSETAAEPDLKEKAVQVFSYYPGLSDNELTRYMQQQFRLQAHLTACQQQGLIHIFKNYCRQRDCVRCPIALTPS
ncbi:MAG TPA: DUF2851 family protein [Dehalococcoidia bacterium]|nr:DUF2851 family protein [Dehalococcoidia bacterium]